MKVVVCGGGISGLSAAYYASRLLSRYSKEPFRIILLEKSPDVGGWLKTNVKDGDRKFYDGPINELGPRSIRVAGLVGNNTLQFVSDMDLQESVLPVRATEEAAKKRLIFVNKQLHELPSNLWTAFQRKSPFTKPLARYIIPGLLAKVPSEYETMHEVCSTRFGPEVANYLISSFCRGVFAADSRQLSMKAAFPPMWKVLKPKQASIPRKPNVDQPQMLNKVFTTNPFVKRAKHEKWSQWATSEGFQNFTKKIADYLVKNLGVEIKYNTEVESFRITSDNRVKLMLKSSDSFILRDEVDHVVFALPSHCLSKIFRRSESTDIKQNRQLVSVGTSLKHIRWVDVAVTNVEYEGSPHVVLPSSGFGHLVPATEQSNVLGVVYDSCAFPAHDRLGSPSTRLTCMLGGSWFKQLFGDSDSVSTSALEHATLVSISEQLGIKQDPRSMQTTLCRKCIPTYGVGHTSLVEDMEDVIEQYALPFSLVGASYWGVSINDCIFNSRIAMYNMLINNGLQIQPPPR